MRTGWTVLLASGVLAALSAGADGASAGGEAPRIVVLVSADAEWRAVRALWPDASVSPTPFGEWFVRDVDAKAGRSPVVFFHGGWGKIAAAGSTQYAIDRWKPARLVNLGTCGGFAGSTRKGDVVLAEKTVVYDIVELMGDSAEAIADYTTELGVGDISGDAPKDVHRGTLASGDRDLAPLDPERLRKKYGAIAGDWESGAIAWVARRNHVPVLILRGVSDVVSESGSEAYGNLPAFEEGTRLVMKRLIGDLPFWLSRWDVPGTHPAP